MVCLDSDILINFLRKDAKTIRLFENLKSRKETLSITSINSFELIKGISRLSNMDQAQVLKFLSNFKMYDFNFDSSKKAADIFNDLKSKGEIIDIADILIASIVLANNELFITGNSKHFERIEELKIENVY